MSHEGLNPEGLGRSRRFNNAEGESVGTERIGTESRTAEVVVGKHSDGDYFADAESLISKNSDPNIVIEAAIDHLANKGWWVNGEIRFKPYRYTGLTQFDITDRAQGLYLTSTAPTGAELVLADGADESLFYWDGSAASDSEFGFGMRRLKLMGNKNNNAAGSGLEVVNTGTNGLRDVSISDVWIDRFPDWGIDSYDSWGWRIYGITYIEHNDGGGVSFINNGTNLKVIGAKIIANGGDNVMIGTDKAKFVACELGNSGTNGATVAQGGADIDFIACDSEGNSNGYALRVSNGEDVTVHGGTWGSIKTDSNATDVDVRSADVGSYNGGGTRDRWNGVIGGGPLGGVDLGSVTGQYQGDEAYADGTTATVSDVIAEWDGTAWVYPDSVSTV